MRMLENILLNPVAGLAMGLVLLVIGSRLSPRSEPWILLLAWLLLAGSLFRTRPISSQILIPRILITSLILSVLGLAFCLLIGWRPTMSRYSLRLITFTQDVERPVGTNMGGIFWIPRFAELHVVMLNDTDIDFSDVDLVLRPDAPVAAIGQNSDLPDVTFSLAALERIPNLESVDIDTGKRVAVPLTLLATEGGHRVRCKVLPRRRLLEVILATVNVNDSSKDKYVMRVEIKDHKTNSLAYDWYAYEIDAKGRIEEFYKNKRLAKTVQIDGQYTADEKQTISLKIEPKDLVGEFLQQRFGLH